MRESRRNIVLGLMIVVIAIIIVAAISIDTVLTMLRSRPLISVLSGGYVQGDRVILLIENPERRRGIVVIDVRVNCCRAVEVGRLEAVNETLYRVEAILSCKLTPGSYIMEIEFVDGVATVVRATVSLKPIESSSR